MRDSDDFVISTTSDLEGWGIDQYLGLVSAHVVTGTNIFSDVFASFSDIFGGRSKSYQNQLTSLDEEIIGTLKTKAQDKGANGLIGIRIDYDEISGTGKSLFMVTAAGTAVRARRIADDNRSSIKEDTAVTADDVERTMRRRKYIHAAGDDRLNFPDTVWTF